MMRTAATCRAIALFCAVFTLGCHEPLTAPTPLVPGPAQHDGVVFVTTFVPGDRLPIVAGDPNAVTKLIVLNHSDVPAVVVGPLYGPTKFCAASGEGSGCATGVGLRLGASFWFEGYSPSGAFFCVFHDSGFGFADAGRDRGRCYLDGPYTALWDGPLWNDYYQPLGSNGKQPGTGLPRFPIRQPSVGGVRG
jgi:hypothetical protein